MKVMLLYQPESDHARMVEDFVRDFSKNYINNKLELVDLNTRDGASTASLYDVVQYPAILVLSDDGQLIKEWHGDAMPPLINEVSYYTSS